MGMLPVSSRCAGRMSNPHEMKRLCGASNAMGGGLCPAGCMGWGDPMLPMPGPCRDLSLEIKSNKNKAKNNTRG